MKTWCFEDTWIIHMFICLRMCYKSLNCTYCTVIHVTYMFFSYTQHVLNCRAHYAYFPSISFIHPFRPIVVAAMSQFPTVLSSSTDQCVSQRASANIMMDKTSWPRKSSCGEFSQNARITDWSKLTLDLEILWKYSNLLHRQHPWASLPQTHRHPRGHPPKWPQTTKSLWRPVACAATAYTQKSTHLHI